MDLTWFCFENELILQYERNDTNFANFEIKVNWPMRCLCIHYCTHMWFVYTLIWDFKTCLFCFVG